MPANLLPIVVGLAIVLIVIFLPIGKKLKWGLSCGVCLLVYGVYEVAQHILSRWSMLS